MNTASQSRKTETLTTKLVREIRPGELVFGVGTDIVEVRRIAALSGRRGGSFLGRAFTPAEIDECEGRMRPEIHFAGKWAAKEAVYKALKLSWDRPFSWKEIELRSVGGGVPEVFLSKHIREQCGADLSGEAKGVPGRDPAGEPLRLLVSISHTDEYAFAVALAVKVAASTQALNHSHKKEMTPGFPGDQEG